MVVFFLSLPPSRATEKKTLSVAAASSFSEALLEIGKGFEAGEGVRLRPVFGSSGILSRQIERGAPFDVFISAGSAYMDGLVESGAVQGETVRAFARGVLVMVYREDGALRIGRMGDLLDPGIRRVAVANPEHAPYGRAAVEAMKKAGVYGAVRKKLVYGENVRQALQFVESGNAEVGFVALSIARREGMGYVPLSAGLYSPVIQTVAVVSTTRNGADAEKFIEYLTGPAGQRVLERYGFRPVEGR